LTTHLSYHFYLHYNYPSATPSSERKRRSNISKHEKNDYGNPKPTDVASETVLDTKRRKIPQLNSSGIEICLENQPDGGKTE